MSGIARPLEEPGIVEAACRVGYIHPPKADDGNSIPIGHQMASKYEIF
jgi:hypothetical protein